MRFLFVDRILALQPGEFIRGIKHITADDQCLSRDEQGRAIFPSSLIGESLGQLAAWNVMFHNNFTQRPVAGVVSSTTLHRPAYVGETVALESFIDKLDDSAVQYHSVARVNDETVFTIDGALGPLLPMADFIDEHEIRKQFAEIYRPAEVIDVQTATEIPLLAEMAHLAYFKPTFDRILRQEAGVLLTAEKCISRSAPYFPDHFPNKPVLPMTILLECTLDLVGRFMMLMANARQYRINSMQKIKMNGFVFPGDRVICTIALKKQDNEQCVLTCRSEVNGKRVCVLEVVLVAEGN